MEHSVERMYELLDVTRSGYYAWPPEEPGVRELENQVLFIVYQTPHLYSPSRRRIQPPEWAS